MLFGTTSWHCQEQGKGTLPEEKRVTSAGENVEVEESVFSHCWGLFCVNHCFFSYLLLLRLLLLLFIFLSCFYQWIVLNPWSLSFVPPAGGGGRWSSMVVLVGALNWSPFLNHGSGAAKWGQHWEYFIRHLQKQGRIRILVKYRVWLYLNQVGTNLWPFFPMFPETEAWNFISSFISNMISQAGRCFLLPPADGEQEQNLFVWESEWAVYSVFIRSFQCYLPFISYNLSLFS